MEELYEIPISHGYFCGGSKDIFLVNFNTTSFNPLIVSKLESVMDYVPDIHLGWICKNCQKCSEFARMNRTKCGCNKIFKYLFIRIAKSSMCCDENYAIKMLNSMVPPEIGVTFTKDRETKFFDPNNEPMSLKVWRELCIKSNN